MTETTGFSLRKWYLDCIADNGDTFIGYSGVLQWRGVTIHYSSATSSRWNAGASTRSSLAAGSFPRMNGEQILWSPKGLNVAGTWTPSAEPIEQRLLDSPDGHITWSCLQPRSTVDISLGSGIQIAGLGYVEALEMTIRPWKLPISEVRWGRFLSDRDAVVWIEWRGGMPLFVMFHNGKTIRDASVAEEHVIFDADQGLLSFTERTVLRKGMLISTALAAFPGITALIPERILRTYECKWRSRGTLSIASVPCSSGWVIHEVVRFP